MQPHVGGLSLASLGLLSLLSLACTATIDGPQGAGAAPGAAGGATGASTPDSSAPTPCADEPSEPGPTPLRRLTVADYLNTVTDLLGDISTLQLSFTSEASSARFPFYNLAREQAVPPLLAGQYLTAAERLAEHAVQTRLASLVPCDPAVGDEACAAAFITSFGKQAFRRAVDSSMLQALLGVFRAGQAGADFAGGIQLVLTAMLQMPEFLYRIETTPAPAGARSVRLDSWDTAVRLSYLLWNSTPDGTLLSAAEQGRLTTPSEVSEQLARMLQDQRARRMVASFHDQWLKLAHVDALDKDPAAFPALVPGILGDMQQEVRTFVDSVVWEGDGKVSTLLSAPFTFLNDRLGSFYGVQGLGATFTRVEQAQLGARPASGIMTMAAISASHASRNHTSPTQRGHFIRLALMCEELPPPPADVNIVLPEPQPNQTRRQLISQHASSPGCSGCHTLMDPIGLGLEGFDAVGAWRTTDAGQAIDDSGEIVGSDVPGSFDGPVELAAKLAGSQQVQACVARQWLRYSLGRDLVESDECVAARVSERLGSGGYLDLIAAITESPQFLYRSVEEGAL